MKHLRKYVSLMGLCSTPAMKSASLDTAVREAGSVLFSGCRNCASRITGAVKGRFVLKKCNCCHIKEKTLLSKLHFCLFWNITLKKNRFCFGTNVNQLQRSLTFLFGNINTGMDFILCSGLPASSTNTLARTNLVSILLRNEPIAV